MIALAKEINSQASDASKQESIDEKLLTQLAYNACGDICPIQAVIGGMAAQEVMKVRLCLSVAWERLILPVAQIFVISELPRVKYGSYCFVSSLH